MQTAGNFFLGLPAISSVNTGIGNNFANYNDLIYRCPVSDSLITFLHPQGDLTAFINLLQHQNIMKAGLHTGLFSMGFRIRKSYLSFHVNERVSLSGTVPKDLFLFTLQGNTDFIGKTADFSSLGIDFNAYREFALGYSQHITPFLTIGARGKLLFGKGNLSFHDAELSIFTNPDDYQMNLTSRFTLNASFPVNYDGDITSLSLRLDETADIVDWAISNFNPGYALDLGISLKPSEFLTLSASVIDLGFINWEQDVYNFSMNGHFIFDGIDVSPAFSDGFDDDLFESLLDSIANIFTITESRDPYRTWLNTKLYVGGVYRFDPRLQLGVLGRIGMAGNRTDDALTFSVNSELTNWLSASVSYSVMQRSYTNFGTGFSINLGPFQFYLVSDHLNALFYPGNVRIVNLWFGMNLVFGTKKKVQIQDIENE